MAIDDPRDALMRRFLLDEVTPAEREQIEEQFLADPEVHEQLRALEDDLLLSHLQGRLPDDQRRQLDARLLASPDLRRRYDAIRLIDAAIVSLPMPGRSSRASAIVWLAMAAMLAVVIVGIWMLREVARSSPPTPSPIVAGHVRPEPVSVATFPLQTSDVRGPAPQQNVLHIPPGATVVELTIRIRVNGLANPTATLKPVSATELPGTDVSRDIYVSSGADDVTVSVRVPASLLPVDDYLLTITADSAGRPRGTVASCLVIIAP